jgi:hemoglobin/transferrin/lactoferrin receptor protein
MERIVRGMFVLAFSMLGTSTVEASEGRLIDKKTGSPVAHAEVMVVGSVGSVKTDADGRFTITPDPVAPFELLVILPDGKMAKPIRIERIDVSGVLTIELEAAVETSVTVSGVAPSIDAAPGAGMTLLSGKEVSARTPSNLVQALENVPGVNQVSEGQAAVPAVRGLAQGRTLILLDGGRVTSERRVGASATFMDPSTIESVDVARGPGSVAYGSDAFGGVISIRTKRTAVNAPLGMSVSGTAGAGIPDRRGSVEISKGLGTSSVYAQAHYRSVADYRGPSGPVLNSGYRDGGFVARAEHVSGSSLWSFGWQTDLARDVERPRNNSNVTRFFYPFENSHRATVSFETAGAPGFSQVRVTGFIGTIDQRTDQDTFATPTRARSIVRADLKSTDFSLRAIGERQAGRARFEAGVDVNGRLGLEAHDIAISYDLAGAETAAADFLSTKNARKIDTGVFAQVNASLAPAVTISAGLRGDVVRNTNVGGYFGDRSETNAAMSGFGSITVAPVKGWSVTGQASRGFRDPRLSDMYYRGPTGRGFITGNPALAPETSVQLDAGVHYSSGPMRISVFGYRYEITNLIERYQTETDFFFFRNRGKARLTGVEVEMRAALAKGLSFEMAGQTMHGKALDDNVGLDDLSPGSLSVVVRQQFADRASAFARIARYRALDTPGPNETIAPGYTMIDAGISFRVSRNLDLRGSARNLTNAEYHASPVSRWVFGPGRNAAITAVIGF